MQIDRQFTSPFAIFSRLFRLVFLHSFAMLSLQRVCRDIFHPDRKRALGTPSARNYGRSRWWSRRRCFLRSEDDRAGKILRRKSEGIGRRTWDGTERFTLAPEIRDYKPEENLIFGIERRLRTGSIILGTNFISPKIYLVAKLKLNVSAKKREKKSRDSKEKYKRIIKRKYKYP